MFAIIDIETTGGQAGFERITEIAIVLHDGEKVVDTFTTLLYPERSIPWSITQITGITDDMVAGAPRFFEVAKQIVQMTEGAVFVAHNVSFDYSFVRAEFERLGYSFTRKQLCTVKLARKVFPGLPSYSLTNLKKHFKIDAERSHRALDDTLATVKLFELILQAQSGGESIKNFISKGIKESKLPKNITLDKLHALPDVCGVYYLHDEKGEVVYVGKSLNIQKRIFEHFADQTPKGEKMREGVADISFELTGSELAALLLESAEIKKLLPRINRAQRIRQYNACIFKYFDQNGYICLAPGKLTASNRQKLDLVAEYPKLDSAQSHLKSIVRQFELCGKLSNIDFHEKACFNYHIKKCFGACMAIEPPEEYNARVLKALAPLENGLTGSFFILDKGRTASEKMVAGVQDGKYLGFGYFDNEAEDLTSEDLLECLHLHYPDPEAGRIVRGFLEGKKGVKVISF